MPNSRSRNIQCPSQCFDCTVYYNSDAQTMSELNWLRIPRQNIAGLLAFWTWSYPLLMPMQGAYILVFSNQTPTSDLPRTASPVRDGSYSPSIQPVSPSPPHFPSFPFGISKAHLPHHSSNPIACSTLLHHRVKPSKRRRKQVMV